MVVGSVCAFDRRYGELDAGEMCTYRIPSARDGNFSRRTCYAEQGNGVNTYTFSINLKFLLYIYTEYPPPLLAEDLDSSFAQDFIHLYGRIDSGM